VYKFSDGSSIFKKARNHWRKILVQAGQFFSQANKNVRKTRAMVMQDRQMATRLLPESFGVVRKQP
jgi:protein-disulfide isomerase-like protein with CxxC motif